MSKAINFDDKRFVLVDESILEQQTVDAKVIVVTILNDPQICDKIINSTHTQNAVHQDYESLVLAQKKNEILESFCLTAKEKKVFGYLELGLTRSEIAEKMLISHGTVRNSVTKILKKLSAKNSQAAIRKIQDLLN